MTFQVYNSSDFLHLHFLNLLILQKEKSHPVTLKCILQLHTYIENLSSTSSVFILYQIRRQIFFCVWYHTGEKQVSFLQMRDVETHEFWFLLTCSGGFAHFLPCCLQSVSVAILAILYPLHFMKSLLPTPLLKPLFHKRILFYKF